MAAELIARENDLTLAAVAERLFAAHGVEADAAMLFMLDPGVRGLPVPAFAG